MSREVRSGIPLSEAALRQGNHLHIRSSKQPISTGFPHAMWKSPVSPQKVRLEIAEKAKEKPSWVHIYPHRISTGKGVRLLHTEREVAGFSTVVHMSYPHGLQRFMNNFAIAFGTRRSYPLPPLGDAVVTGAFRPRLSLERSERIEPPKCDSSPAHHRPNRWMRPPAPRCFWTSSRALIGRASGRERPTPITPAARPVKAPRTGIASATRAKAGSRLRGHPVRAYCRFVERRCVASRSFWLRPPADARCSSEPRAVAHGEHGSLRRSLRS